MINDMKNLLLSEAIGDITGMPYEFDPEKGYERVNLLLEKNDYTDDTVCTFACAEALLRGTSVGEALRARCVADPLRGYGGRYVWWIMTPVLMPPYDSFGNGSAMRVSSAGFMARTEEECVKFATQTAMPTHNHPEGVKGAVSTALAIFHAFHGKDKDYIRHNVLEQYYPDWADKTYKEIKPTYGFDETCQRTVPAALICFLESKDYVDCLKLAIALGGDADTLAAISGPMAYAMYRYMPQELIDNALRKLPQWMVELSGEFDRYVEENIGR